MPSAWKLIIEDDAGKQIVVPFTRDVITIGRKEGNTIRLTERNVSRNHARLSKENGHVVLEDLKSFNGIKLNGDRIDGRVLVHEGDTIQIGDYHLALHAQDGVAANGSPAQSTAPSGGGAPMPRSQATQPTDGDDDEFAGDTQRWEPPAGTPGISVQSLATQEDRSPITDEHTVPAPSAPTGGLDSSSSLGLDNMRAGAPSPVPTRARDAELEPTLRQTTAPPPITLPPAAPMAATGGPAMAANGAQASMPSVPFPNPALPNSPTPPIMPASRAPVPDKRPVYDNEQTDMLRPAPGVADDLSVPRLVVVNTIFAGSTFSLRAPEAVIGRTEDNDITIEHKSVSRNHAKVVREGDRVRILDLKSANGLLVNDEEVEAAVLRPGDIVELGRVRLRFVPVGERFVVPPDEIERARIADAAGDDFENDIGTGVTNPIRKKARDGQEAQISSMSDGFALPPRGRPPLVYAAIGGAVLLVIILVVALAGGDDDEPPPPDKPPAAAADAPKQAAVGTAAPPHEPKPIVEEPTPVAAEPKPDPVAPSPEPVAVEPVEPEPGIERERRPTRRRKMSLAQMQEAVRQAREQKCPNKERWIPRLKQVLASDPPAEIKKDAELFLNFCPK